MQNPAEPEPEPSERHTRVYVASMAKKFLAAQEERILNQYTVDGQRLGSYGTEVNVNVDPTDPISFFNSLNYIPVEPRHRDMIDRLKIILGELRQKYLAARAADVWYDPMDDASSVEEHGVNSLSSEDQQFVRAYLQHLRKVTKPKGLHVMNTPEDVSSEIETPMGRHAMELARQKGRRALQLNGEGSPIDS